MFKGIVSASVFSVMMTLGEGGVAVSTVSCTPADVAIIDSQVPTDVLTDIECAAAELLQGALSDPLAILTKCGPLVMPQLIVLAEDLLATPAPASVDSGAPLAIDAGAPVSASSKSKVLPLHLASIVLTDAQRARIQAIHDAALKLVDGGS